MTTINAQLTQERIKSIISIMTHVKAQFKADKTEMGSYPFHKVTKDLPQYNHFKTAIIEEKLITPIDRVNFELNYEEVTEHQAGNVLRTVIRIGREYQRKARLKAKLAKESKSEIDPQILEKKPASIEVDGKKLIPISEVNKRLEKEIVKESVKGVEEVKPTQGVDLASLEANDGKLTIQSTLLGKEIILVFKLEEVIV